MSWLGRDWHARFGNELLRGLVEADHGALWIVWSLVNLQHILHAGYEGGVGIRRDDPLLLQVRLERVFFSVLPIVLSLARSTIFSSTTAIASSCGVHRLRPLGGLEQARAISLASASPSKMRGLAEDQRRLEPFLHQSLAGPGNRGDSGIQRTGDLAGTPALAGFRGIGLEQDTRLQQLACTVFAATDQRAEPFALLVAELHDILLYGGLFRGHDASPVVPETSIQRLTTKSMT